ncbi:MAG: prephenate dehydrogenase/arogenate dehydrogenase family protein [Magnetococcales bacterium]|nr:prephenate dehydrogenase/arogenate dehydrogenase family protein [Magnetococcales bacterium]MBF0149973.1 prephenate dehydrogenase/arogenate dehydrogenase family protein [Magnetococcales bacterium]MBF0173629.1 prephenate dehydrogenase/arogenate dehydrogenase family protein [Magnetococcales bacterium]MBF0347990.1 prephenate dehydrogenase/arogenate dehydrogenase family protein [Magnetococcales bacterium]MBF0631297.1 prephenate dehydrogenase/arogenate dehydrogenase family protein [Magnetococcales
MSFFIKKLSIIGVGLIGGSLARALKERDCVGEVVGINRTRASLEKARELGVIDALTTDPVAGVRGANMVLVATPVRTIVPIVRAAAPGLMPGAVVTDAGSVKGRIVAECEAAMPQGVHFVGGHPIAGTEHSGVEASFATLFEGSRTILTPTPNTAADALEQVSIVWEAVGSHVEIMDPMHHDQVLAATSHLPHLMAYNIVKTLSDLEHDVQSEVFRFAASGFRDFTRIASSDPTMWRDICLENRAAILEMIGRFGRDLDFLRDRVAAGDGETLHRIFAQSRETRDRVLRINKGGRT